MKNPGWCAALVALAPAAAPSDLNLKAQSQGSSSVTVGPGAQVPYRVLGELSDSGSQGLAMFTFDLAFTGGPLAQASTPTQMPIANFVSPLGLNNPSGYGGTVENGVLRQIGGAQNTIKNVIAPQPIGSVITGVGQPGLAATLVTGSLTTPYQLGSFTLAPSNLLANVIRLGPNGTPFWRVDPAGVGTLQGPVVKVEAIRSNTQVVSVLANGSQTLSLSAGPANAGRAYLVLGSISGTAPGVPVGAGLVLPLHYDEYFGTTRSNPNTAILQNSLGVLDAQGNATCVFHPTRRFEGLTVHHAFLLLNPVDFVSEAEPVKVIR